MQTKVLIFMVVLALLTGACQAATPAATEPAAAVDTEVPAAATQAVVPAQSSQPLPVKGEVMPGCRVIDSQLTPNPTLQALFPAVTEKDWIKGASDATVTITDYSDFQ